MRALINPQFLIRRPAEKGRSIATGLLDAIQDTDLAYFWEEISLQQATITVVQPNTDTSAVREFCEQLSKLHGIEAVLVEEVDGGAQHVTTFLSDRAAELEAKIYGIEADTMLKHPSIVLDFHVRVAPKDENGRPELPDGSYYLLTWRAA